MIPSRTTIGLLAFEAGFLGLAFAVGALVDRAPFAGARVDATALLLGLVATAPSFVLVPWSVRSRRPSVARLTDQVRGLIVPLVERSSWAGLAVTAAFAGIAEEALFRGAIQPALARAVWPPAAIVLTGLLFGLMHPVSRLYVLLATAVGVYFGVLAHLTGNLVVPIVVHGVHNLVAVAALRGVATPRG